MYAMHGPRQIQNLLLPADDQSPPKVDDVEVSVGVTFFFELRGPGAPLEIRP